MWYIVSKIKFSIMCFNNRMAKRKSKTKTAMTVSNCVFSGIKHFKDMRFYDDAMGNKGLVSLVQDAINQIVNENTPE